MRVHSSQMSQWSLPHLACIFPPASCFSTFNHVNTIARKHTNTEILQRCFLIECLRSHFLPEALNLLLLLYQESKIGYSQWTAEPFTLRHPSNLLDSSLIMFFQYSMPHCFWKYLSSNYVKGSHRVPKGLCCTSLMRWLNKNNKSLSHSDKLTPISCATLSV